MAIELSNGVSLPDIPEGMLDTYPCVMILHFPADGSYTLLGSDTNFLCLTPEMTGVTYDGLTNWGPNLVGFNYLDGTWQIDSSITNLQLELDGTVTIVWSNHDIYYVAGIDSSYNPIIGDVYFAANSVVYAEMYAVASSIIRSMANNIRRLKSTTGKMTVEEMDSALNSVEDVTEANWIGQTTFEVYGEASGTLTSETDYVYIPHGFAFRSDDSSYSVKKAIFPKATRFGGNAFSCKTLEKIEAPLLESIGISAFAGCTSLSDINGNVLNITEIPITAFSDCNSLTKLDFPVASSIGYLAFSNCANLETVILRKTDSICTLSDNSAFSGGITTYIYVPSALVDSYKADSKWSTYANQIRAIEDYPDICGTT